MTAAVAGSYAASRVRSALASPQDAELERARLHRAAGGRIARTLGDLKGAVMKVGQMASIARDVLPRELADALAQLQRGAPPMGYDVIAQQIEAELGRDPMQLFDRFDREPFAAASIGQVHRARTDDGREVVVKVQYPGVDEAVGSDLTQLKLALFASGLARIERRALDRVFAEVRARLHEELDYTNEAQNVRRFRELFAGDPDVVIPDVVGERSSARVLTLGYEPGEGLAELAEAYPRELRDRVGQVLFRVFARQLFELRLLHADPNPANFAVREGGRLVMYDFGCVKRIDPAVLAAYRDTIRCALAEDYAGVEDGLQRMGARNPDGPDVEADYYRAWRNILLAPFLTAPYDFGTATLHEEVVRHIPTFMTKRLPSFSPPAELVFIDRTVVGHYYNLRQIGARGDWRALLEPHVR